MKRFYCSTNIRDKGIAIDIYTIYKLEETEMGNTVIWHCFKGKHEYDIVKEKITAVMYKLEKLYKLSKEDKI